MSQLPSAADKAEFWVSKGCAPDVAVTHVQKAHTALTTTRLPPQQRSVEMSKMHALYLSSDLTHIAPILTKLAIEAGELQPHQKFQDLIRKMIYVLSESCSKHRRFVLPAP